MNYWNAILALIGVVLGAIITYLTQSRLLKKQREWQLDNQKREWQRKRLSTTLEAFRDYLQQATIYSSRLMTEEERLRFRTEVVLPTLSFDLFEDNLLKSLYESYSKNNGVFIEYMDSLPLGDNNLRGRIQAKQTLSLMADIFYEIQRRVLQLTYETFA